MIPKAFQVDVSDWPDASSIVRTVSRARAKYLAWKSAQDAGYDLPFGRFRVKRAPVYDTSSALVPGKCYALDFAQNLG